MGVGLGQCSRMTPDGRAFVALDLTLANERTLQLHERIRRALALRAREVAPTESTILGCEPINDLLLRAAANRKDGH